MRWRGGPWRRGAIVVGLSLKYRPVIKVKSDNCYNNITRTLISLRNDQIYSVIPSLNKSKSTEILQFAKEP
jgi:hypothetical protein